MIRRLLADEDLRGAIVSGVVRRQNRIDFMRAAQVPLEGLADLAVLRIAAGEERILVSHDFGSMFGHFRNFVAHQRSPGLILIPQDLGLGRAIECLSLVCEVYGPADLENSICLIPSFATCVF